MMVKKDEAHDMATVQSAPELDRQAEGPGGSFTIFQFSRRHCDLPSSD